MSNTIKNDDIDEKNSRGFVVFGLNNDTEALLCLKTEGFWIRI